ncbi:nesprin-2-like [Entelurus aequoreus]|uniref:nesprin-2-like n=1 Tax=Entelurus aequoreus TaxID=161455 RepID=UPI002B1E3DA4|nr:nesprin-2-like [Entelurus aequoreus]
MADQETQNRIQTDLGALQEEWDNLHGLLSRRVDLAQTIVENWQRCEAGLTDKMLQLKDMKTRLNQSLPESDDGNKESEDPLEDWAESLRELSTMKTDLSQYVMADDVLLLEEQVKHLHCQWEELCLKVSLRKQEIADRLNAWVIFNEKNKELCEWLTHMQDKVEHASDLNIEEMVEKLKKDCMEEINLSSENKSHLKQLGEQLISASDKTKQSDVNDKINNVNDRWQHLFDHIEARVRKLKETLATVQQLDKNMSNLRTWLSRVEAELSRPPVYVVCHGDEIQRKLAQQQELQRDIEQHTESVTSVLTLCDVLLRDADAYGSDSENDSILQTTSSLDRRWRNICAMSMERRMRIEETWRLWCKFLDDYARFEDWLKASELTAANPDSADVLYTSAKEELKKFEAFQRQVHERLTQLELVNKQYRRLARENRTDAASKLRLMVAEGNRRWDGLQRRVAAVLRRLKHFTSQREDFEVTRDGILVWLTEMDLQLTNVEHFSESDVEDKMRQLIAFQQEITLNANKIDALIVSGENLIQKSAPLDAVLIEDELEELHSYCQEVFGRVARFHQRLVHRRPVLEEERELSDLDNSPEPSTGRQTTCHLLVPPLEHSGRETPVSVDSIPLEWDHTVDVGGSSSHEDDEDATFFSALSVTSARHAPSWHQSREASSFPLPAAACFHQQGYVKLMSDCSGSIDSVKKVKLILNDGEEGPEASGLTSSTAHKHTGAVVMERWEVVQAEKVSERADIEPGLQQWRRIHADLADVTSWLAAVLPELERLQNITPCTSVDHFGLNVRTLKDMQRTFSGYKRVLMSLNLSTPHFPPAHSAESRELKAALSSANRGWTRACGALARWEATLHAALMQCQEFHQTLHSLLAWLAQAEGKLGDIGARRHDVSHAVRMEQRHALTALQEEMGARQSEVSSLQAVATQLLLEAEDSLEAKEKVHIIGNKLRLLLRDAHALHAAMRQHPGEEERAAGQGETHPRRRETPPPPPRHFLSRVLRAAFPLQLVLLLLLALACLVPPPSSDDSSCTLSNNFARSFYPMLSYTNGPPPT